MENPHRKALLDLGAKVRRLALAATEGSPTRRTYLVVEAFVEDALHEADRVADGRTKLVYNYPSGDNQTPPSPYDGIPVGEDIC